MDNIGITIKPLANYLENPFALGDDPVFFHYL
jgi:hypothetical protein